MFRFAEYWWLYGAFTVGVLILLALDLGVFHRRAHAPGFREAGLWISIWVALALAFCFGLYHYAGKQPALEFLTGYVVEESLSLDNMFVFVLIFAYFRIPNEFHHRVLFYGILGALLFRGIFIALGATLIQFGWVVVLFGVFLIFTGLKMMRGRDQQIDLEKNWTMRLVRKALPVHPELAGQNLIVRRDGKRYATPLLLTLAAIEGADIVFAIDSVPAIFAITNEPFIVYTSNVFAILGLRSMYFLLAGAIGRFHLLRYGLAVVLIFVGAKMSLLNTLWGGHFPIAISLVVIGGALAASIALSIIFPKEEKPSPPPAQPAPGNYKT